MRHVVGMIVNVTVRRKCAGLLQHSCTVKAKAMLMVSSNKTWGEKMSEEPDADRHTHTQKLMCTGRLRHPGSSRRICRIVPPSHAHEFTSNQKRSRVIPDRVINPSQRLSVTKE